MKKDCLVPVGLLCLAIALTGCPPEPDNGQDHTTDDGQLTELEGTWISAGEDEYGRWEMQLEFCNDEVISSVSWDSDDGSWGENEQHGVFTLDTTKDPKHIDLFFTWESVVQFTPGAEIYEEAGTLDELYREEYDRYPEEYPWLTEVDGTLTQVALGIYRVTANDLTIQFGNFNERPSAFSEGALILTRE